MLISGTRSIFVKSVLSEINLITLFRSRDNDMSSSVGQDNLNYRTLKEEQAHPTEWFHKSILRYVDLSLRALTLIKKIKRLQSQFFVETVSILINNLDLFSESVKQNFIWEICEWRENIPSYFLKTKSSLTLAKIKASKVHIQVLVFTFTLFTFNNSTKNLF